MKPSRHPRGRRILSVATALVVAAASLIVAGPDAPAAAQPPTSDCDGAHEAPLNLSLRSEWGSGDPDVNVTTSGIWAIWWYDPFDHASDADELIASLDAARCAALAIGMADPPNPGRGHYVNIYIHHGSDDPFPQGWGNGVGTDRFALPYMTLPDGVQGDDGNTAHEGFHIFQWGADSPGFAYDGDSAWYTETSAQWFAATTTPLDESSFLEADAIDANPHLALWHSFDNEAPGDATDWYYQVRQYGLHTLLWYLSDVRGIDPAIITSGFYGGVRVSPQRYIARRIGTDRFRRLFADWAAENTADLAYLTREQVARARLEGTLVGDPDNVHRTVADYVDTGTRRMVRSPASLAPRGWGYNVIRIENTTAATYRFVLDGDTEGSEGAAAVFEARVVITDVDGNHRVEAVDMDDATSGSIGVKARGTDTRLDLVIAAVPSHWSGNQTYGYRYAVVRTGGDHPVVRCRGEVATHVVGSFGRPTAGPDVIVGTTGADTIDARAGDDIVCARGGNDEVRGGRGADTVVAGAGDDVVHGGAGPDIVVGGGGADQLDGGGGRDVARGGSGSDRCVRFEKRRSCEN